MKIILSTILMLLSIKISQASWKIECEVLDQNQGRSVVTFSSNLKLRDTEKVKFGKKTNFPISGVINLTAGEVNCADPCERAIQAIGLFLF